MKDNIEEIQAQIENEVRYERTRILLEELNKRVKSNPSLSQDEERITSALQLMLWAHFDQKDRPDGQPYINHPLDVALHIINEFGIYQSDLVVAALLHDTIEDQPEKIVTWGGTEYQDASQALQILESNFGENVASYVSKLTIPEFDAESGLLKKGEDADSMHIRLYLEYFERIFDESEGAFTIKMADFSQNALHIGVLDESPRKDWFRRKYGPVILMVIERLKTMDDVTHPLFGVKNELLEKLRDVYKRDYEVT